MKPGILLAACLVACNASPPASAPPKDAEPVASEASPPPVNVLTIPTVEIVTPRQPRHILIVGDSEACAVAPYAQKVADEVNKENGWPLDKVAVDCKGGTVVQYWGAGGNLKAALQRHPNPDDVLVFLGTNHYWQKIVPPTATVTDLLKGTNCVWVGNTAVKGHKWPINHLIKDAVTPQCSYFDTEAADIPLWDGVHPDRTGAVKWLRLVWPTIPPKYEEADQ